MPSTKPPTQRKPFIGLLKPGQSRTYTIRPAVQDNEKPLIMGPTASFSFDLIDPEHIELNNHSERIVVCMVAIVPAFVANATTLPWGQLWQELQKPGGPERLVQGFWARFQKLLLDP